MDDRNSGTSWWESMGNLQKELSIWNEFVVETRWCFDSNCLKNGYWNHSNEEMNSVQKI